MMRVGIRQGLVAHTKMIKGLIYASIPEFFDRVPIGRILNRASKDITEIDENVEYAFGWMLVKVFGLTGNLIICVYASTPYVLIPIVVFLVICYRAQCYYMKTKRECVRLESVSNSPIVSGFTESIVALPTIRAYNL
jgi:ABC-type multidrug transport system fused ATPase/permease subunit